MYQILYEKRVYKDLDRIPAKDLDRIHQTILSLESNPRKAGTKKLQSFTNRYRIRQGDYRIVFTIDEATKAVIIVLVRHRKEVYRAL